MKRKILSISLIGALTLTMQCSCGKAAGNSSRRDGEGASSGEADLENVVGTPAEGDTAGAEATKAPSDNQLPESTIKEPANAPVTDEVSVVRKLTIPEAVVMEDGDVASFYNNEEFKNIVPVDAASFDRAQLPSKYDSRDYEGKRYVTVVEDQGYSYLCWTFASMGAIESDLLKHHEDIGYKDIDLSEKHLAYYNMHKAEGSVGGYIDDDYREFVNVDNIPKAWVFDYDTNYVANGGVTDCCISILTAWKGPMAEAGDDAFNALYGSQFLFSDNGNPPSDGFASDYHVQGVYEVRADLEHNLMVKQMIMEHGAATVGVNADSKYWKDHSGKLYSSFDGGKVETANHEVLIVGWDDDYSASNFRDEPEGDGAWICRNSWGDGVGEGGFFYLSYYDETTAISNAAAYNVAMPGEDDWYDNNYQAAGFLNRTISTLDDSLNTVSAYSDAANPYGVMYEAQGKETLKAVGLMALDMYQQYDLEIYVNPSVENGNITFTTQDEPALWQKVSAVSGGFHTFPLEKAVDLEKGDTFLILVKPATDGRLVYEAAEDTISDANYDEWQNLTGNIHNNYTASGCSYYISDDGLSMVQQDDKDFFVKGYTCDR